MLVCKATLSFRWICPAESQETHVKLALPTSRLPEHLLLPSLLAMLWLVHGRDERGL